MRGHRCLVFLRDGEFFVCTNAHHPTHRRLAGKCTVHVRAAGAKVVVAPGRVLESASVVIADGVIDAVALAPRAPRRAWSAPPTLPAGARAIDCSGKTIYAGFIDAYSEIAVESAETGTRHWNRGVQPQLRVTESYEVEKSANEAYRKSGFVARLVAPQSGQIKGVSAVVSTADGEATERTLRAEVALHATLTVSRRGRDDFPGSPMGAFALVRQTFYDVQWYRDAWRAYRANPGLPKPETNTALATLVKLVDRQMPLVIDTSNERYFLRRSHRSRVCAAGDRAWFGPRISSFGGSTRDKSGYHLAVGFP